MAKWRTFLFHLCHTNRRRKSCGMGHGGDAREILLKKERRQTADKRTPLPRKILRKMWDIFAGYGYRLRRPLCWMAGFVLFGAFVFGVAGSHNLIAPHQPAILASKEYQQELKSEKSRIKAVREAFPEYPEFSPLVFSLDVFVPLFVLHQEPFWSPISKGGRNWKEMSFLIAFVIMCHCAWLFQHWCERDDDHAPKFAWAMIGLAVGNDSRHCNWLGEHVFRRQKRCLVVPRRMAV